MRTTFFLLFILATSCGEPLTEGIKFYETTFDRSLPVDNKWIMTPEAAKKIVVSQIYGYLPESAIQSEVYYHQKALYPLRFGGGDCYCTIKELSTDISRDTLFIIVNHSACRCGGMAEKSQTDAFMEIDKSNYPDFEKLSVVVISDKMMMKKKDNGI